MGGPSTSPGWRWPDGPHIRRAEFDVAVGYTVRRPTPRPVEEEVATAFRDFDYAEILRIERMSPRGTTVTSPTPRKPSTKSSRSCW